MISLKRYVPTTRQVNTTAPLSGGGDLSADRTVAFADQAANSILAGPTTGAAAAPSYRSLVLADMPAGVDGKQTATTCAGEYNELSADLVLTDADDAWQFLDSGGTDRNVTLPALSTSNPRFLIVNMGNTNGILNVLDSSGTTLAALDIGEMVECFSDGTTTYVAGPVNTFANVTDFYDETWRFAATSISNGMYLFASTYYNNIAVSTLNNGHNYYVTQPGTLRNAWFGSASTGNWRFKVFKNGVLAYASDTLSGSTEHVISDLNIPVVAEDLVHVQIDASPTATAASLTIRNEVTRPIGVRTSKVYFGGGASIAGRYLTANYRGDSVGNNTRTLGTTDHVIPHDCNIFKLAIRTASADATTIFRIMKNGVLDQSFTMPGANAVYTASQTSYVRGDLVAIEYPTSGGTLPQGCLATIEFINARGFFYCFGSTGTTSLYQAWGYASQGAVASAPYATYIRSPHGGRLYGLAWSASSAPAAGNLTVSRNGATLETLAVTAVQTSSVLSPTNPRVTRLDRIEITGYTSSPTGLLNLVVN